jgi:hypothetical protein
MTDDYVSVPVMVQAVTEKAVMLSSITNPDVEEWVPRSCLHGGDDLWLTKEGRNVIYQEREFRLREWVAKLKGFV